MPYWAVVRAVPHHDRAIRIRVIMEPESGRGGRTIGTRAGAASRARPTRPPASQCTDSGRWPVQREFNRRMKTRFQKLGVDIAYPAQTSFRSRRVLFEETQPRGRRRGVTPRPGPPYPANSLRRRSGLGRRRRPCQVVATRPPGRRSRSGAVVDVGESEVLADIEKAGAVSFRRSIRQAAASSLMWSGIW